jgi:outer membrane protein assembly factor BamB
LVWAGPDEAQKLFAFNAKNGKRLWQHQPKGWISDTHTFSGTPLSLAKGVGIYHDAGKEEIVVLDLATGAEQWRVSSNLNDSYRDESNYVLSDLTSDVITMILMDDDLIPQLRSYALDGSLLSEVPTTAYPGRYQTAMFRGENAFYIAPTNIYKLDKKTGAVLFKADVDASGGFGFADNTLYAAWGQRLSAVDAVSGNTAWHYDEAELRGLFQTPALGKNIYLTYSVMAEQDKTTGEYYPDSWLFALSKEGKEVWRKALSPSDSDLGGTAFAQTPSLIFGGVAVIGDDALLAFTDDGTERWRFPLNAQSRSAGSAGELVYVTAVAPRWRHWLAYLNPAWH